jgi:RNA-directed DNA polymerase
MNFSQFKKREFKRFCFTIGVKPQEVLNIVDELEANYKEWDELKQDKKTNEFKRYKDGTIKKRTIRSPKKELKRLQSNLKNKILAPIKLPDNIHGGVKKKSNITNAKKHQGNKYIFTTDLKDFYPSVTFQQVYDAFLKLGFSTHFAHWITLLSTWKYELPQGTPTSTHVANLVFLETDKVLIDLCNTNNITYTRYVDDLTFSSQQDFKHLLNEILSIVTGQGFKISYRKTKYCGNQTVTGIDVFLNKIDVPEKIKEKSKLEIEASLERKPYTDYMNNVRKTKKKVKII